MCKKGKKYKNQENVKLGTGTHAELQIICILILRVGRMTGYIRGKLVRSPYPF
jgi:hypothetical protein